MMRQMMYRSVGHEILNKIKTMYSETFEIIHFCKVYRRIAQRQKHTSTWKFCKLLAMQLRRVSELSRKFLYILFSVTIFRF